ncbi:MAG: hypothetical protein B7X10_03325 [Burkholderiales bacterium 21-58-4]|nr:MAG: hypothetical protein B7X10_03325 [Burkholderiales bacterium 21-58-4]
MAQLEQTPGYQFNLQQGLESTQNGYAAKGLGVSGAALKGAANYASGLAQNTYAQQAQIYYANQQNAFNKLMGVANMGQNSAAQQGQLGQGYLNTSVNALTGGANAAAAGDVGSAGAWANAFGNISNTAGQFGMLQWMQQNGLLGANNTSGGSAQGMGGG